MGDWAYLDEHNNVVPCDVSSIKRSDDQRTVKKENCGDYLVSTVFLGLNHGFGDSCDLWFETFCFKLGKDEKVNDWCEAWGDRCETYNESLKLHEKGKEWALKETK